MEEQSKEEILSDLYAIRAAMSLVSKQQDVTTAYQGMIERSFAINERSRQNILSAEARKEQQSREYLVETQITSLTQQMTEIQHARTEKVKEIKGKEGGISYIQRHRFDRYHASKPAKFFGIMMGVSVALLVFSGMIFLNYLKDGNNDWIVWIVYGTIFAMPIISTIIYALVYRAKVTALTYFERQEISDRKYRVATLQKEIIALNKQYDELQNKYQAASNLLRQGMVYYDPEAVARLNMEQKKFQEQEEARQRRETQVREENQSKITQFAEESQEIIENAKKLYPIIDFRDWANVDLIIFYYETGRADTMKEALQQVDRQRQNEALIEAVEMATEMIAKTIRQSVNSLEKTLDSSFRQLSVQLEFQHRRSLEEVSRLGSELEVQNEQLEKLGRQTEALRLSAEEQARVQASNQALTNALLEKINTSSTQLAYDMDKQLKLVHHISV